MKLTGTEDLRVQKTIEAIRSVFEQMICEMDYHEMTVKELCERAKIKPAVFIYAIRPTDDQRRFSVQIVYISISCKQDVRICVLHKHISTMPLSGIVGRDCFRALLMISMDREYSDWKFCDLFLHMLIPPVQEVVKASVSQNDQYIIARRLNLFTKLLNPMKISMCITGDVDHFVVFFLRFSFCCSLYCLAISIISCMVSS